jgi:hypothetical protein
MSECQDNINQVFFFESLYNIQRRVLSFNVQNEKICGCFSYMLSKLSLKRIFS